MGRMPEEDASAAVAILQRLQLTDKLGPKAERAFRKVEIRAKVSGEMIIEDAQGTLSKFYGMLIKVDK